MPQLFNEDSPPLPANQSCERYVELVVERGETRQQVRPIEVPVFLIGADPDCDLVLGDRQFADCHAYIHCCGSLVAIRNLGGLPDFTVNSRVTRWAELKHADRLRMGPYQFRVRIWPRTGTGTIRPGEVGCNSSSCLDVKTDEFLTGTVPEWPIIWTASPRFSSDPLACNPGIGVNRIANWW